VQHPRHRRHVQPQLVRQHLERDRWRLVRAHSR
jgi:hypothetical protein